MELTQEEINAGNKLIEESSTNKVCCTNCGNDLYESEIECPNEDDDGDLLCDRCYSEQYEDYCPLCEEYYLKPKKPKETYFIASKEAQKESGLQPGVYHVLKYPVFAAAIGGLGDTFLFSDAFELKRSCDINSMLRSLYGKHHNKVGVEFICPDCAERFSRTYNFAQIQHTYIKNNTIKTIYERGVIQKGK